MPSVAASGTLSGQAINAEQDLYDIAGGNVYVCVADLSNMAAGDTVVLTVYDTAISGGSLKIAYQQTYSDAQVGEVLALSVPVPVTHGARFTLNQTAGVAKSFAWEVRQL